MKRVLLTGLIGLAACSTATRPVPPQDEFFAGLRALCGARFEGAMTFPESGSDDFSGKLLVAEFSGCAEREMRIPFVVGDNRSRTWVFSHLDEGLRLQHDHRHADGTPDEVTLYGGFASDSGTALSQSFPADAYTAGLIPDAATNVWTISLNASGDELTYHLERHQKPRFTAKLKRVK
ncbi:MAG: hypothetical protein IPK97_11345 [Ahniella sp.]|nr:hypothetical protein [Ahniella sp.]